MSDKSLDVLTIGNAIVDVFATCEDAFLETHGIGRGMMNLVDAPRSATLYAALDAPTEISGGSAANTAVGVAAFGGKAGFAGRVRDDVLGKSFSHDIAAANVRFANPPKQDGSATASSIILVTPDAARSMNTYLGACIEVEPADLIETEIAASKIIYLEGYLFDAPHGPAIFARAAELATKYDAKISLSLSDPWCAERHRDALGAFIKDHVNILFANEDEAMSLCEMPVPDAISELVQMVDELIVTRGAKGAFYGTRDAQYEVPAMPQGAVIDTTGAGDLFAAGYLYGRTNGYSIEMSGRLASLAAGEVIAHIGARPQMDLKALAATL
ncbi:MAG: adenosine kinase [Candidatus Puniceispirillum sp.]|uniref:adenosine kinase n=1 Tax=Candidatus Puniceispirillum sp. TaxID=2026719 RepID=UPI001EC347A6|nr:adenosine kinase [Candidatus Puniceispirillum sp.]MBT6415774.1 adenosine kinase [Candidatus Puniceispirillum sp.]MBT6566709.1 adenosine kinase [Candidatus Puniceispirillum sp.]